MMTNNGFCVATYNILAKSLGTNMIPWVMRVSPQVQQRIHQASGMAFSEWVDTCLQPEYMRHFHKNFDSGNYAAMRKFWGAYECNQPDDIPSSLSGLSFVEANTVSYKSGPNETKTVATTLKGTASKFLPKDVFDEFFNEVYSLESEVFDWSVRGPRILRTILNRSDGLRPDLIAFQEYDCHDSIAEYRENGCLETFAEAMAALGYDGAFLKDPLLGRDPPSGLGVYWRRDCFETAMGVTGIESIDCESSGFGGAVRNCDMKEMWHKRHRGMPDDTQPLAPELMAAADRRNVGVCRLVHKMSGKPVSLVCAHLMTTSRDSTKTNYYPGEVRAGELQAVKNIVESSAIGAAESLLFMGDLNTDARNAVGLFSGRDVLSVDGATSLSFDTGFDEGTKTLNWKGHKLLEAFSDKHQWGQSVGLDAQCTSRNAKRVEWIDYMFLDENLRCVETSNCKTPSDQIPDRQSPSDHIPLLARVEFQ